MMDSIWPPLLLTATTSLALFLLWRIWSSRRTPQTSLPSMDEKETLDFAKDPYEAIEPLSSFDWKTTPPIQVWPFKPKYHLSMSLEKMPLSDLVEMDNTFLARLNLRRQIMDDHPAATCQCNPSAEQAVLEFYDWMVRTYLPRRFPTIYQLIPSTKDQGPSLLNTITQTSLPLHPTSPLSALDTLGSHVDTDFLILLPSSTSPPTPTTPSTPIYHLEAFINCFPSGFSTQEKCGQPLATIHAPVPGYEAKLEKSMDRFFARLEVGKAVKRSNWSITTHDELFTEGGNHFYEREGDNPFQEQEGLSAEEDLEKQKAEVDVEKCRLRCERQTLHRLPGTKALVFAFKTYLYRLEEVKEAGLGDVLAEAIDGLAQGTVPGMAFYKRQVVWGNKVKKYLRT